MPVSMPAVQPAQTVSDALHTATTMLSMTFGFDRTIVLGLVLYAVATLVMVTAPRAPESLPPALDDLQVATGSVV